MKTKFQLQDNTCPQTPAIRQFAKEQMEPLFSKNPRITSLRLKLRKLPGGKINDVYRINAVASGRGFRTKYSARSITVRAALKTIRAKYEATPRPPINTSRKLHAIGIPSKVFAKAKLQES